MGGQTPGVDASEAERGREIPCIPLSPDFESLAKASTGCSQTEASCPGSLGYARVSPPAAQSRAGREQSVGDCICR